MIKEGKVIKTKMNSLTIEEVSAVDRPAQQGARMAIMKRAPEGLEKTTGGAALTTETDGHSHLLDLGGGTFVVKAGSTDFTDGHSHPWLMDETGQIVIGSADGHTHGLQVVTKGNDLPDGDKLAADDGEDNASVDKAADKIGTPEDQDMTDQIKKAADDATAAKTQFDEEIAKLTKRAERAEQVAELSDEHRTHFKSMTGDNQEEFLAKSADDRDVEIQSAHDANKVVYKGEDGAVYRKNDDPRLIELAKSMDAERKMRFLSEAKAAKADLEKRASELTHIPDQDGARIALLKAIDTLPEDEQKAAMTALKAQNDRLGKSFTTAGTSVGSNIDNDADDDLTALAKRNAERDGITYEQAYAKALETPEGAILYTKSLEAQMG